MSKPSSPKQRQRADLPRLLSSALAAHRDGRLDEAVALYDEVLANDRRHGGATHLKGTALLQAGRLEEAHELLSRAIRLKGGNGPAHSDLGLCLMRMGRATDAAAAYAAAVKLMPDAAEVHANFGHCLLDLGRHADALTVFERASALAPGNPDLAVHQATALLHLGRPAAALVLVGRVLAALPGHPLARKVRGDIAVASGEREEALEQYDRVIETAPDFALAWLARAGLRLGQGDGAGALSDFERVLALAPGLAEALAGRGTALILLERASEAVEDLSAALSAGAAEADVYPNLAVALLAAGRASEALGVADAVLARGKQQAQVWLCRANALAELARLDEALESYDRALSLRPDFVEAMYEKASTLRRLHRGPEAIYVCRQLLQIAPHNVEARWFSAFAGIPAVPLSRDEAENARANVAISIGELADQAGIESAWRAIGRIKPFYLSYSEQDNLPLLEQYGRLCHRIMSCWQQEAGIEMRPPEPQEGRRLRVGILSGDFSHQSVWTAITKGWVLGLDRRRFEVHLFDTGIDADVQTDMARENAESYVKGRMPLAGWAQAVVARRLDVLIYPEIGVDQVSLQLASLRLAPVQAVTWGHPDTSGIPTLDAYLSGEAFEPDDAQSHYTERLVRLPGFGVRYSRLGIDPAPFDPDQYGLPSDRPLLIAPGTPFKYAPEHDWVLPEIARRLGQASIVIFEPGFYPKAFFDRLMHRLRSAFVDRGLDMNEFIHVLPWLKPSAFFGLMHRADAFLDTIGFSGFNTAMQALECGLPIVTREGRFLRGRLASALYREMSLSDLISGDEAAYIDLAVRLATDTTFNTQTRDRIIGARDRLFEDERPIKALEAWIEQAACARNG